MSYVNNQLIECIRASSEEAKSQNNNNVADFTNKLGQAIKLDVGDVVSVERAFINGLGAGNQESISFNGRRVQPLKEKKIKYTKITGSQPQTNSLLKPYKMDYNLELKVEELETENLEIKDNECKYSIGYYINSCNHPSYIQLPRRFVSGVNGYTINSDAFDLADDIEQGFPYFTIDPNCYAQADWRFSNGDVQAEIQYKQRVDNSRFTLFLRDYDFAGQQVNNIGGAKQYDITGAKIDLLDDDHRNLMTQNYLRYRELHSVKVDDGFNTPESVASQIKLQMNDTKAPEPFEINDSTQPDRKITLTTILKAETYKPFNVANYFHYSKKNFDEYVKAPILTNDSYSYFSQYWAVGIKRPEIYEAGRLLPYGSLRYSLNKLTLPATNKNNIKTSIEMTQANIDLLLSFFDATALYSELWDNLDKLDEFKDLDGTFEKILPTFNNSRFLHMSRYGHANYPAGIPHIQTTFGNDGMDATQPAKNPASAPLFFYYDDSQRDLKVPNADTLSRNYWDIDKYVGGFAQPYYDPSNKKIYISLVMRHFNGTPLNFYTGKNLVVDDIIWGGQELHEKDNALDIFSSGRYIGFDKSCTAFSTCMIVPYSSHIPNSYEGLEVGTSHTQLAVLSSNDNAIPTIDKYTQAYLGANNPLLEYNEETKRFEFSQLHIAENIGNRYNAGDDGGIIPVPINADAGAVVYKINPHIDYDGFAPTWKPYAVEQAIQFADPLDATAGPPETRNPPTTSTLPLDKYALSLGAEINRRIVSLSNENIDPYNIFDAWGGIYFDDMGYNIEEWDNVSLWGRLGFAWEQFNAPVSSKNTLSNRVNQDNRFDLYRPTTNAEVDTTDTKAFIVNLYGAPLYTTMIGAPSIINTKRWIEQPNIPGKASFIPDQKLPYYPTLSQITTSQTLPARNLPKSMINPFYTIRSNILGDTNYLGAKDSGMRLPVCGIVDRYGAQGDFYFGNPSDLQFTITKQTNIADIQTAICNPDGTYADIDDNSGVIYKIQRNMPAPKNIIAELIEEEKKKK